MQIPSPDTYFIGHHIVKCDTVTSTNDVLMDRCKRESVHEGTVVLADLQTKGKGQNNNSWESDFGLNLLMSVLLRPDFLSGEHMPMLAATVALGVRAAVQRKLPKRDISIKWPNDILCDDSKIAGILIENLHTGSNKLSIVGVGINVNQTHFEHYNRQATSLKLEENQTDYSVTELCSEVCNWLERYYMTLRQPNGPQQILDLYVSQLYQLNETVKVDQQSFLLTGVNLSGRLLLERDGNTMELEHKEKNITWN